MPSIVSAENLSKRYILNHQKQEVNTTLRDALMNGAKHLTRKLKHPFSEPTIDAEHEEFWSLKDVSFDIQQGERLGVIGRNGAGKSTLLKILSRITEPTSGRLRINGRVSSLLEVGTGFHPDLSGRENIFLNGAILGMSRAEIRRKFDEIVAFAEVEQFLDTPVKRYSSGMYVRLAFAVAAHLEPEILIVDEVLAVGDAQFQKKCLGKMESVGAEGRTIIFVSHNMYALKNLCKTGIVLDKGKVVFNGNIEGAIGQYLGTEQQGQREISWDDIADAPGNENVRLISVSAKPKQGTELSIDSGILIGIRLYNNVVNANLDATIHLLTVEGIYVLASGTLLSRNHDSRKGCYTATVEIPARLLNTGMYKVTLILGRDQLHTLCRINDVMSFGISGLSSNGNSMHRPPGVIRPMLNWSTEYAEMSA